ncbi:hypothetical protein AFCDBAGC_5148 [Methylobacterium cerastii]|uniref:Peptidase C1A papain C-terminal domain-containing protein n=1 Tax=Methylobacterium cerastii TaxID=932741 RepID=A0ABQ4QQS8_9HYPH|nr:C1 family peptidase [Methylobacterium cerastii]GJD47255.1 hypothetical protein AFCDBAGC_5148 [Methylobacterium cerastii]
MSRWIVGLVVPMALWLLPPHAGHAQGWDPDNETSSVKLIREAPGRGVLPPRFDLSPRMPPPRSQGPSNTCVSWAVTYAAASQLRRRLKNPRQQDLTFSPSFSYNLVSNEAHCMGLSSISDTLNLLRDVGALPIEQYAFDPGWCGRKPTADELANAAQYRIKSWAAVDAANLDVVKSLIANDTPVIYGMSVGSRFAHQRTSDTFNVVENGPGTLGHVMVVIGYDDERQAFRVQNSAGTIWGDSGRFWLSYQIWTQQVRHAYIIEN